jgi:hypothetical protein
MTHFPVPGGWRRNRPRTPKWCGAWVGTSPVHQEMAPLRWLPPTHSIVAGVWAARDQDLFGPGTGADEARPAHLDME